MSDMFFVLAGQGGAPTVPGNITHTYWETWSADDDSITWGLSSSPSTPITYEVYVSKAGSFLESVLLPAGDTILSLLFNYYARTYGSATYGFKVRAKDTRNIWSAFNTETFYVMDAERTGPMPTSLSVTSITSTSFVLNWVASTRVDNDGYKVYKDSVLIATLSTATLTLSITGLSANTSYNLYVAAYNTAGGVSCSSKTIVGTTSNASYYTWSFQSSGYSNDINSCAAGNGGLTLYSTTTALAVGSFLYTNTACTTAFNGGSLFRKCSTGASANISYRINSSGEIIDEVECI